MTDRAELRIVWKRPDYSEVLRARLDRLVKLRADPMLLAATKAWYADNPADFINDWGMTVDPRNAAKGLATLMPFVLFPKQRELIEWIMSGWRSGQGGQLEKSRDMGASWLAMGLACTLCIFRRGVAVGFGSRKEDLVDNAGDPDTLFYKGREFMRYLPPEYRSGWEERKHSAHMKLLFPMTGSSITGEAGDNIGRGGRKSMFFVDEAAYLERPKLIDASLSANTDCRIDMSSVNGMANSFAERRHRPGARVFTFHYRYDPRKDDEWKAGKLEGPNALDPVIWASEYEINYTASVEGIIIPSEWVAAAIDAHVKLKIEVTGAKRGALDVADTGADKNAFGHGQGVLVRDVISWRGSADYDIFHTVERAFLLCDTNGLPGFLYDADGLGAGVRGDARKVNEARKSGQKIVEPYRGSGGVFEPERIVPRTDRKAKDFYENYKAQAWWETREKFRVTHRAVVHGEPFNPSNIISLSSGITELDRLRLELSQPTWVPSKTGKWMVDKTPEGAMSPNLADCVIMIHAPRRGAMVIDSATLKVFGVR